MSRMSAREIVPGLLYQRGQFLTWTADQKMRMLGDRGITTVVNLWSKVDPDLSNMGDEFLYLCWLTSPHKIPSGVRHMAALIAYRMENSGAVLIHCEAGRGRSVWLCARVVAAHKGWTHKHALDYVESVFPNHSLRPELLEDLR